MKSFVIVRALRKASFIRLTKNCDAVTWFWSKHWSASALLQSGTYMALPIRFLVFDFTRWSPSVPQNCWNSLGSVSSCTYRVYSCHSDTRFKVHLSDSPNMGIRNTTASNMHNSQTIQHHEHTSCLRLSRQGETEIPESSSKLRHAWAPQTFIHTLRHHPGTEAIISSIGHSSWSVHT